MVTSIHFEIPKELTREVYVQIIRKVLACNRWELTNTIKNRLRETQRDTLDEVEIDKILEEIILGTQEKYREDVCALFNIPTPPGETAKRMMQKAYLVYSTISSIKMVSGQPMRAKWQDQISHEYKIHSDIIKKIAQGSIPEGIEHDPRLSVEQDYKMNYDLMDGYLRREDSVGPKFGMEVDAKGRRQAAKLINKIKNKRKGMQGDQLKKTQEEDEFETDGEPEEVKDEIVPEAEVVTETQQEV